MTLRQNIYIRLRLPIAILAIQAISMSHAMDTPHNTVNIQTINSIKDIEKIADKIRSEHPDDSIVIAFDWDNTLSLVDGCSLPLREGEETSRLIEKLMLIYRVYPIVLTSRLQGYGEDQEVGINNTKDKIIYEMQNAAPSLKQTPYLLRDEEFALNDGDDYNTVIIDRGIVFAGSHTDTDSMKGPALGHLMSDDSFLKNVDHIIFVDNDQYHIDSIIDFFKDQDNRSKITAVHYPQLPVKLTDKSLCEKMTSINGENNE